MLPGTLEAPHLWRPPSAGNALGPDFTEGNWRLELRAGRPKVCEGCEEQSRGKTSRSWPPPSEWGITMHSSGD